jgi:hypothetical protein
MHECPDCGQACDCDGEDTWFSIIDPEDCECPCLDEEEEDCDDDYDGMDGDHVSGLASAGFGTDEDYGGPCEDFDE